DIDEDGYKLLIDGLVGDKRPWTLDRLYALPQETQITRLVCIEGWSAIGKWTGTPLREFLRRIGADTRAKYVHFTCAEGYSSSIDMATALHPQTQLTFKYDGLVLPPKYGFPMRVRIPTMLGFKNPKHVIGLVVLNNYAGGCFWGVQDLLRRYPGVISTRVGYTGGEVPNATYRNHGNHAEAIEITFDPQTISYRKLLEFFFQIHDPSTLNRQGNDRGASYRSAIFYT